MSLMINVSGFNNNGATMYTLFYKLTSLHVWLTSC